jgi:hypothetical protein
MLERRKRGKNSVKHIKNHEIIIILILSMPSNANIHLESSCEENKIEGESKEK